MTRWRAQIGIKFNHTMDQPKLNRFSGVKWGVRRPAKCSNRKSYWKRIRYYSVGKWRIYHSTLRNCTGGKLRRQTRIGKLHKIQSALRETKRKSNPELTARRATRRETTNSQKNILKLLRTYWHSQSSAISIKYQTRHLACIDSKKGIIALIWQATLKRYRHQRVVESTSWRSTD